VIRDLVGAARSLAGLVLIRLGGWVAGVGGGDTRVSSPEEDEVSFRPHNGTIWVAPPTVTPEAQELVARREVRVHPKEGLAVQVPFRRVGR
jgi:hypothetical protein